MRPGLAHWKKKLWNENYLNIVDTEVNKNTHFKTPCLSFGQTLKQRFVGLFVSVELNKSNYLANDISGRTCNMRAAY